MFSQSILGTPHVISHNWLGSKAQPPLQPSRVPKTDLQNHSNRGFDEMTSIVVDSFLELLLAMHDASTDRIACPSFFATLLSL